MASYNEKYNVSPEKTLSCFTYFYIDNESSKGVDTLYMPHPEGAYDNCYGYWLDSAIAESTDRMWRVGYSGDVYDAGYDDIYRGLCPVVSLPSNIQVTKNGNVWTVVQ